MTRKKRTNSGRIKPQTGPENSSTANSSAEPTPPCAQAQSSSSTITKPQRAAQDKPNAKVQQLSPTGDQAPKPVPQPNHSKAQPANRKKRQKLSKLPDDATLSKRPLLHPAIPTPFSSSLSPKVLYITASTPYIPAIKRIRKLLSLITKRSRQSVAAQSKRPRNQGEATGRLTAIDVERNIAEEASGSKVVGESEKVYLKATGRAIPRALELGVHFQTETDCLVRVDIGNVRAIDDIEVGDGYEGEDVPETRLRTLSTVTVSIGLK